MTEFNKQSLKSKKAYLFSTSDYDDYGEIEKILRLDDDSYELTFLRHYVRDFYNDYSDKTQILIDKIESAVINKKPSEVMKIQKSFLYSDESIDLCFNDIIDNISNV